MYDFHESGALIDNEKLSKKKKRPNEASTVVIRTMQWTLTCD